MLGVTSEQFPRGGALLISLMGAAGMLSVAVALPIMGAKIDEYGGGAAGGGAALQMMAWLGVILTVIFTGIWLYFKARGGYRVVHLNASRTTQRILTSKGPEGDRIPVLGIDVGTGGSRAIVVDEDGALIASATIEHAPFASPGPAWAEQEPEDWWRASREAVRRAVAESGLAARSIACVGLSGQMHGAVLLDEPARGPAGDHLVRSAHGEQCEWLTKTIGASRLLELTCNPALPNFTLTKLLWVRQHEPDAWGACGTCCCPRTTSATG